MEIATEFLNVLLDAVVGQGAAFDDFARFLRTQGEAIRPESSKSEKPDLDAAVSVVHELFEAKGGKWVYVPKFESYFTRFSQETLKLSTACASYDEFRFDFDLPVMTSAFFVEGWKNSKGFRERVREFIDDHQKVDIKGSKNFFEGMIDSSKN